MIRLVDQTRLPNELIFLKTRDLRQVWTAPAHVKVYASAFDVTPARLITAIICERGILKPPFGKTIKKAVGCRL